MLCPEHHSLTIAEGGHSSEGTLIWDKYVGVALKGMVFSHFALNSTAFSWFGTLTFSLDYSGLSTYGRRSGLMVSVLVSGSSGPGSSPCRGHCVVFLGKTLNSHSAPLYPGV